MNTARTPLFLMANLGAEVSRLLSSKEKGDTTLIKHSLERAERILVEIQTLPEMRSRAIELAALHEAIATDGLASPQALKAYFEPFALRAVSA